MTTFGKVAEAARKHACYIYRNFPVVLIRNPLDDVGIRMIWDNLCPPPDSPPPPESPFVGGQCCDVLYQVKVAVTTASGTTISTYNGIYGTVKGIESNAYGADQTEFFLVSQRCNGTVVRNNLGRGYNPTTRKITQVIRSDGKPDNCGNPPKQYPPAPGFKPSDFTSPPTPITLNDNDTLNLIFTLVPPLPPLNIKDLFPPIQVVIKDPKLVISVPFNFNFDNTINIGRPGSGDGFGASDRDTINNINNITTETINNTTNIDNSINTIIRRERNEPVPDTDFDPFPSPKPPGKYDQERLFAVEVQLTVVPKNAKKQFGAGAPDVVYAGWFEWRRKGFVSPREPINFEKTVFLAPIGVDGFAYTLYNGFQGVATPVVNKEVTE